MHEDPDAPKVSAEHAKRNESLVDELGLYPLLVDAVDAVGGPVEYGVVEHQLGLARPDIYLLLLAEFGHVQITGPAKFTMSSYLARLLGNLDRRNEVVFHQSVGTGGWAYNSDVSAWSTHANREGEVTSWATWATANGIDPMMWPHAGLREEAPEG